MSSDRGSSEPKTEPLPVITNDMLPPLETPRVPELDDCALAELLAELEGDDAALLGSASGPTGPTRRGASAQGNGDRDDPAGERDPVGMRDPAGKHDPAGERDPAGRTAAPPPVRPPAGHRRPTRQLPEQPIHEPRLDAHQEPEIRAEGPYGPVIHSRYGDFRPPVTKVREERGLIALPGRARGRIGSVLFTVAFVVIFLLIVIQTLVSLVSGA